MQIDLSAVRNLLHACNQNRLNQLLTRDEIKAVLKFSKSQTNDLEKIDKKLTRVFNADQRGELDWVEILERRRTLYARKHNANLKCMQFLASSERIYNVCKSYFTITLPYELYRQVCNDPNPNLVLLCVYNEFYNAGISDLSWLSSMHGQASGLYQILSGMRRDGILITPFVYQTMQRFQVFPTKSESDFISMFYVYQQFQMAGVSDVASLSSISIEQFDQVKRIVDRLKLYNIPLNADVGKRLPQIDLVQLESSLGNLTLTVWEKVVMQKTDPSPFLYCLDALLRLTHLDIVTYKTKVMDSENVSTLRKAFSQLNAVRCTQFMLDTLFNDVDNAERLITAYNILINRTKKVTHAMELAIARSPSPERLANIIATREESILKFVPMLEVATEPEALAVTLQLVEGVITTFTKEDYEQLARHPHFYDCGKALVRLKKSEFYSDEAARALLKTENPLSFVTTVLESKQIPSAAQLGMFAQVVKKSDSLSPPESSLVTPSLSSSI